MNTKIIIRLFLEFVSQICGQFLKTIAAKLSLFSVIWNCFIRHAIGNIPTTYSERASENDIYIRQIRFMRPFLSPQLSALYKRKLILFVYFQLKKCRTPVTRWWKVHPFFSSSNSKWPNADARISKKRLMLLGSWSAALENGNS